MSLTCANHVEFRLSTVPSASLENILSHLYTDNSSYYIFNLFFTNIPEDGVDLRTVI